MKVKKYANKLRDQRKGAHEILKAFTIPIQTPSSFLLAVVIAVRLRITIKHFRIS